MEEGLLQRAASETVLNIDNVIKPLVQGLAQDSALPREAQDALSAVLAEKTLGHTVAAIKIWSPSGTIVYSNRAEVIGRTFPIFANLQLAFNGELVAQFDDLDDDESDEENEFERSLGQALLEIYAPLRESGTNRIIAVAEFYEIHEALKAALRDIRLQTWAAFSFLTIAIIAIFSGIAIKQKRQGLERQVVELSRLLSENRELQQKIRNAHQRTTEINELFLRRVSAELHDGPAQLLGFALLRLDTLRPPGEQRAWTGHSAHGREVSKVPDEFDTIRNALDESLNEIRSISVGLAPPDLAELSLARALEMACDRHARRTGTFVRRTMAGLPDCVDPSLKVCLYRFAQEGLNNAFRHAGGRGQALRAHCESGLLEVVVSDDGAATINWQQPSGSGGLGLAGLRGRIEALGGEFDFRTRPGKGAILTARFTLAKVEVAHV